MLSLFRPRCPLDPGEKTWIEYRVSWLRERFGDKQIREMDFALPTGEFFPLPYAGSQEDSAAVLRRVCDFMQVDAGRYHVKLIDPQNPGELPPLHEDHVWVIWPNHVIHESQHTESGRGFTLHVVSSVAEDLETMIAVFSREISRSSLWDDSGLTPRTQEFEHTVELMPLFFGLGIFSANAVLRETIGSGLGSQNWGLISQGALPARFIGFALGLVCWLREELRPGWRSFLRKDAEGTLKATLRYIEKTGDTILDRESQGKTYDHQPVDRWIEDLRIGSPSRRVAAMWAIHNSPASIAPEEHVRVITENLVHHNVVVRSSAARTLDSIGEPAASAVPDLLTTLEDRNGSVRMVTALALGRMTSRAEEILPELLPFLNDGNVNVANAAAWSLGQFGHRAEDAGPGLVRLLRRGILHCEEDTLGDILDALLAVSQHPEEVVMESLLERDSETCQRALDLIKLRQIDADVSGHGNRNPSPAATASDPPEGG